MAGKPTRGQSTDNDTLHVKWNKMTEMVEKGGSEIFYYSVYLNDELVAIRSTSEDFILYQKENVADTE